MKGQACVILFMLFGYGILSDSESQEDPDVQASQEANDAQTGERGFFEGGAINKEEFKKNFRDLLGHTWTNFDMPNLDFYILPFLNYSTGMLEPHFTHDQVRYHWEGNVEAHRKELNRAINEWRERDPDNAIARKSLLGMIESLDQIPRPYLEKIRNHGGSYINHALFFGLLSGNYDDEMRFPFGKVREDIEIHFQTFFQFKSKFNVAASKIVGSGNVFLVRKPNGNLKIETMSDNDTPLIMGGYPLLVLDMWEHAWYLKHKHQRSQYADDWWMLVDWNQVDALNDYWTEYDQKKKEQQQEEVSEKPEAEDASVNKDEL